MEYVSGKHIVCKSALRIVFSYNKNLKILCLKITSGIRVMILSLVFFIFKYQGSHCFCPMGIISTSYKTN